MNIFKAFEGSHGARRCPLWIGAAVLWAVCLTNAKADDVFYSTNPSNPAYDDIEHSLRDVYGTSDLQAGVFEETDYALHQTKGNGDQSIPFAFLYDDGDYHFEFGYFEITSSLLSMPSNTAAQKEAWMYAALQEAVVVLVDKDAASVPPSANRAVVDPDDLYTPEADDAHRDHDAGKGFGGNPDPGADYEPPNIKLLPADMYLGFFIIPNNTLANFLADYEDNGQYDTFSLFGSGSNAWPLTTVAKANPGPNPDGSGDGYDQHFSFWGTTRNSNGDALADNHNDNFAPDPGAPGALVTFEDISRNVGGDQDFNDLHFYIGNVYRVDSYAEVPEASTFLFGGMLALLVGVHAFRRYSARRSQTPVGDQAS